MAILEGFDKAETKKMKTIIKLAGDALVNALDAYIENETQFKQNFSRWFGKPQGSSVTDLIEGLANMNGQIMRDSYTVVLGPPNGNENANMLSFKKKDLPHGVSIYERVKEWLKNHPAMPMTVRPQMLTMPLINIIEQTQVETFLHELSHFAAGTEDIDEPDCYDLAGVAYCKAKGSAVAITNAENVGFFLTDFVN